MDSKELGKLANGEIDGKLDEAYKELFNLRFQRAQGQLSDSNGIKRVRHNIARMKTVLRQRELAAQVDSGKVTVAGAAK